MPRRRNRLLGLCLAAAALGLALYVLVRPPRLPDDQRLAQAEAAFGAGRFDVAEQTALLVSRDAKERFAALLLAANAATRAERYEDALRHAEEAAEGPAEVAAEAAVLAGNAHYGLGRSREAEKSYRRALALDPGLAAAHRQLGGMLGRLGRRVEASEHLFALLKEREITVEELILLGQPWPDVNSPEEVARLLAAVPEDPRPLLGAARSDVRNNRLANAEEALRRLVAVDPQLTEAQVWLGWALMLGDDAEAFLRWNGQLTSAAEEHPLIWLVAACGRRTKASRPKPCAVFGKPFCAIPTTTLPRTTCRYCSTRPARKRRRRSFTTRRG